MSKFKISGRSIGPEFPPYIIAEMSANHNGNLETAFKIIDEAESEINIEQAFFSHSRINEKLEEAMKRGVKFVGKSEGSFTSHCTTD